MHVAHSAMCGGARLRWWRIAQNDLPFAAEGLVGGLGGSLLAAHWGAPLISVRSGLPFSTIRRALRRLAAADVLHRVRRDEDRGRKTAMRPVALFNVAA